MTRFTLDGHPVSGITTTLEEGENRPPAMRLSANRGGQHAGVVPNPTDEFCIDEATARELLAMRDSDYSSVVHRYVVGDDILNSPRQEPSRWIINFRSWPLDKAMQYPAALDIIRRGVKPIRDRHRSARLRDRWWQFARTLDSMWAAIDRLDRYIIAPAQGKRIHMCWAVGGLRTEVRSDRHVWCPSNLTNVFPFNDSYAMGVLSSTWHLKWASQTEVSSQLETRQRYISTSFHTFPWPPNPTDDAVERIRVAADGLVALRSQLTQDLGLTELYNQAEDGAYMDLLGHHNELDAAVAAAYGWTVRGWREMRDNLYALNQRIASGMANYEPFGEATRRPQPSLF